MAVDSCRDETRSSGGDFFINEGRHLLLWHDFPSTGIVNVGLCNPAGCAFISAHAHPHTYARTQVGLVAVTTWAQVQAACTPVAQGVQAGVSVGKWVGEQAGNPGAQVLIWLT